MIKQIVLAALICSYSVYSMEQPNEMAAVEALKIVCMYEVAKNLYEEKVKQAVNAYNQMYRKRINLVCENSQNQGSFRADLVLEEGMLLSNNFCYVKLPTRLAPYCIGSFQKAANFKVNDLIDLRDLIFADMKIKPYTIQAREPHSGGEEQLHFYSVLKIDTIELPPAKTNYLEI